MGSDDMDKDETTVVDTKSIVDKSIKDDLVSIFNDLEERGYEPVKQMVAYLVSGDPGYISSYKECRSRVLKYEREDILEVMLTNFTKK